MSRDLASARLELDYLRELNNTTATAHGAALKTLEELAALLALAAELAILETQPDSAAPRFDCLTHLINRGRAAGVAAAESLGEITMAGDLLGGRILTLGREIGVELDSDE